MKCRDIIEKLEQEIPLSTAEGWDNPGLQVGNRDSGIQKIYVALDATDEVLEHCVAWGADLLITHHPLLMSGILKVNSDDFHGRKILKMAENHLAHYAMHTNYDVCRMGQLCSDYLKMTDLEVLEETGMDAQGKPQGIGTVGNLPQEMTLRECCEFVKQAFSLDSVKAFGDGEKKVRRAALCPGSGKSLMDTVLKKRADVYITGDYGHHDGLDAMDQGLSVIDAGHYGVEHVFVPWMEEYLRKEFPNLEIKSEGEANPFFVV